MSMENIEMFESVVVAVICAFAIITLLAIFVWAKGFMGEIETYGSSDVIAEKVFLAPCISRHDLKDIPENFIFEKNTLTLYNNSGFPCITLSGSYYFMEVTTWTDAWYFSNAPQYPYAYNTIARGWTMGCISNFPFSDAASMRAAAPNPFDYNINNYNGGVLKYSANVIDGDMIYPAYVRIIIDPDTGTNFYGQGFPLCLKDVQCPGGTEQGKCWCVNEGTYIAPGVTCGV